MQSLHDTATKVDHWYVIKAMKRIIPEHLCVNSYFLEMQIVRIGANNSSMNTQHKHTEIHFITLNDHGNSIYGQSVEVEITEYNFIFSSVVVDCVNVRACVL